MVSQGVKVPCPEVAEKPVRRRFAVEYKVKILAEADACTETGQMGTRCCDALRPWITRAAVRSLRVVTVVVVPIE
jgi:hypothetical protein